MLRFTLKTIMINTTDFQIFISIKARKTAKMEVQYEGIGFAVFV